ncbi:MAG: signal peptidase I [Deltaproteobacteria bacterium]|nr:signal peptidase I [Deltaproteobacteria bacterium]
MSRKKVQTARPSWWRGRKILAEGRRHAGEVRRGLRKLGASVPEPVRERALQAVKDFEEQRRARPRDWRVLLAAAGELDRLLAGELASARKGVIRQYAESIAWAGLIALVIRFFLLEPFQIPTGSMIPSLQVEDHIFVAKCSYGIPIPFLNRYLVRWGEPARGDVIVFPFPVKDSKDYNKDFIKRVVGLPGDRIRLRGNRLHVNGEPVDTELLSPADDCAVKDGFGRTLHCLCDRQRETLGDAEYVSRHIRPLAGDLGCVNMPDWPLEDDPFVVPEGHVFCMGDNRDNSSDGRYWGTVPIDTVKGRALFIWYASDLRRIFDSVP